MTLQRFRDKPNEDFVVHELSESSYVCRRVKWIFKFVEYEIRSNQMHRIPNQVVIILNGKVSERNDLCVPTPHRENLTKYFFGRDIRAEIYYLKVIGIEANFFPSIEQKFPKGKRIEQDTPKLPIPKWHSLNRIQYVASQVKAWTRL